MNLPKTTINVASTLGKSKIASLDSDTRPAIMEIVLRGDPACQYANLTIADKDGRMFGVQIGNQSLIELQKFLNSYV